MKTGKNGLVKFSEWLKQNINGKYAAEKNIIKWFDSSKRE